ncbi:hypothetical protein ACX9MO_13375 [Pseudooceanicola sp. 502str34]
MQIPFLKSLAASRDAAAEARQNIDALREEIAEVKNTISRLRSAPQPVAEAMEAFDRWSEKVADAGVAAMHPEHLLQPEAAARGLRLPYATVNVEGERHTNFDRVDEVLLGLVLAASMPALREIVEGQLDGLVEGRETLSADARAERIAEAEDDLLQLELTEEAAVRSMEAAGVVIARRADADPRAILASDASLATLVG